MAHLIDKSALVAEIEKIIDTLIKNSGCIGAFGEIQITVYESVLSLINTLEVKEVDLEKEIDRELETRWRGEYLFTSKFRESAKHFFELGLKAQKGEEV